MTGADNRKSQRFQIRLSAEVSFSGKVFTATTRDLSVGGVCLESDRLLPEGNALTVGLFLVVDDVEDSTQPPLEMRGKVAWSTPGEGDQPGTMGVRFEGVSATQMTGLTRFLRMLPQQP
jgi:hypothetical protein